jgi:hypothetical protein
VDFSGANPVLFATTTEASANRLVTLTDTGASSTFSVLSTALANTAYRGVDFTPISPAPEPATVLLIGAAGLGAVGLVRRARRLATAV